MFDLARRIVDKIYTIIIRKKFRYCGKNVTIRFPIIITKPEKISIGDNVFIGEHVWLNAGDNPLSNETQNHENDLTLLIKSGSLLFSGSTLPKWNLSIPAI